MKQVPTYVEYGVGWDEFGTRLRIGRDADQREYIDLRVFDPIKIMPMTHPGSLHFYWTGPGMGEGNIETVAITARSKMFKSLDQIREFLSQPAVFHVLYVYRTVDPLAGELFWLRYAKVDLSHVEGRNAMFANYSISERIALQKSRMERYPHRCPKCGHRAFIGFNQVDCSMGRFCR